MNRTIKQPEQKPITLKGWAYTPDGKEIKELIKDSFLEFYLAKQKMKPTKTLESSHFF